MATRPMVMAMESTAVSRIAFMAPSCARWRPQGVGNNPDPAPLFLSGRADDPVVAEAADVRRRCRLEALLEDASGDVGDGRTHALQLLLRVFHGHPLAGQDVEVALGRCLEPPGLA